jgi:hypothetical protein
MIVSLKKGKERREEERNDLRIDCTVRSDHCCEICSGTKYTQILIKVPQKKGEEREGNHLRIGISIAAHQRSAVTLPPRLSVAANFFTWSIISAQRRVTIIFVFFTEQC